MEKQGLDPGLVGSVTQELKAGAKESKAQFNSEQAVAAVSGPGLSERLSGAASSASSAVSSIASSARSALSSIRSSLSSAPSSLSSRISSLSSAPSAVSQSLSQKLRSAKASRPEPKQRSREIIARAAESAKSVAEKSRSSLDFVAGTIERVRLGKTVRRVLFYAFFAFIGLAAARYLSSPYDSGELYMGEAPSRLEFMLGKISELGSGVGSGLGVSAVHKNIVSSGADSFGRKQGYSFYGPTGAAVGPDGKVYVVDRLKHRVLVFGAAAGSAEGSSSGSSGSAIKLIMTLGGCDCNVRADEKLCTDKCFGPGQLSSPYDVALSSGPDGEQRIYVSDTMNHRIQVYDDQGNIVGSIAGQGRGSFMSQLDTPLGIAVDKFGNVFVADSGNNRVQVFDGSLNYVTTLGGNGAGNSATQFDVPTDVAVDSAGNAYVADSSNFRIQVFDSKRKYARTISRDRLMEGGGIVRPDSIAVDSGGDLYVVDWANSNVRVFNSKMERIGSLGGCPCSPGPSNDFCKARCIGPEELSFPHGIALDEKNALVYVTDAGNNRVQAFKVILE